MSFSLCFASATSTAAALATRRRPHFFFHTRHCCHHRRRRHVSIAAASSPFHLRAPFQPTGDQPAAIRALTDGVLRGETSQTLLGATGTGKTFVMAHLIANVARPTLILAPNKTLAAQLRNEIKSFFPTAAVEYFVSYYDYFQPEAYTETTDTYISKVSSVNQDLDRFRIAATRALYEREDVVIVASVSCIYGLGMPAQFLKAALTITLGEAITLEDLVNRLGTLQYSRKDSSPDRSQFVAKSNRLSVAVAWEDDVLYDIELDNGKVVSLSMTKKSESDSEVVLNELTIYPTRHFIIPEEQKQSAIESIFSECRETVRDFRSAGKNVEADRINNKVQNDMDMMTRVGFCSGIENYSRHMAGRSAGDTPDTLLDYFPVNEWLLIVDESHVTIPQVRAMSAGDRARKQNLVRNGFRLPSALDNRPLNIDEFWGKVHQTVFVSATPADFELERSGDRNIVEQVIRPTGILDPIVRVVPSSIQVEVLLAESRKRMERGERVIVTTLTKRMSEDLCEYIRESGLKSSFLHSDVDTLSRLEILDQLNLGAIDVLVGVNLLREGLDLPTVSLVAIMDADKEGFLRSETALLQTIGRAARHVNGEAILFAERETGSMQRAMAETARRRAVQLAHNVAQQNHPEPIAVKLRHAPESRHGSASILDLVRDARGTRGGRAIAAAAAATAAAAAAAGTGGGVGDDGVDGDVALTSVEGLREAMKLAASQQRFEAAAALRERLRAAERQQSRHSARDDGRTVSEKPRQPSGGATDHSRDD